MRVNDTKSFIKKANIVHKKKFTYKNSNYINSKTKIVITCPEHGDFEQVAASHISGKGCSKCYMQIESTDTESFIKSAAKVHNNVYNYDKVVYKHSKKKIIITCPEHGDFEQTPNSHLSGKGCNICSCKRRTFILSEFIKKANEKHNCKYNYDKSIYINSHTKLIITCPVHGDFEQVSSAHLRGHGCTKCEIEKKTSNTEKFIDKAKKVHGNKFSYNKVKYIKSHSKVIITCPVHGDFEQLAYSHLNGKGCLKCAIQVD